MGHDTTGCHGEPHFQMNQVPLSFALSGSHTATYQSLGTSKEDIFHDHILIRICRIYGKTLNMHFTAYHVTLFKGSLKKPVI